MILAGLTWASGFTPPPGLAPEATAIALTSCSSLFAPLNPRYVDVNHADRVLIGRTPESGAQPWVQCPAVEAFPVVEDGALRCTALPKGGYTCKAIPGNKGAQLLVDARVAEARPALAACVAGAASTWAIALIVSPDGTAGDIEISVRGALDPAALDCLTAIVADWKFGPLVRPVPLSLTLGP